MKDIFILLAVLSLNSSGLAAHASIMSTMPHEMGGMSHEPSDEGSCAALCRTGVINKHENDVFNDRGEEDDHDHEPALSLVYTRNQSLRTDEKSITQTLYATEIKPPPKVPIYILHGVFRV
jgi:hypothetical protein